MPLNQEEQQAILTLGREHLAAYAVAQYPWFSLGRHHKILFEHLEALERGDFKKLMVFAPPQNGKTSSCSELFPSWCMGRHPWWRTIVVSYAQPRADDFGGQIRTNISSPYHQGIFPDCRLNPNVEAKDDFELLPLQGHPKGAVRAAGRKASITGLPADLIVVDDPYASAAEARSEAVKVEVRDLWNTVIDARMHPGTRLLLIQTRWDPDDLAGWELDEHPKGWKVLSLPAIGKWVSDLPEGWFEALPEAERARYVGALRIPSESDGEPLWPERFPLDFVLEKRDRLTRDQWLSVYQQMPTRDGDSQVFQDSWFRTINSAELEKKNADQLQFIEQLRIYIIADPANAKNKRADFTNIWVVGLGLDHKIYVVDGVRDKLDQRERWDALKKLHEKWNTISRVRCVGWEQYSLQTDIQYIKDKQKETNYRFEIQPLGGNVRKEDRIRGLVGMFRDSDIYFVNNIPATTVGSPRNLTEDFRFIEYLKYPATRHDDMLDSLARVRDMLGLGFASFPTKPKQDTADFYRQRYERLQRSGFMGR